MDILSHQITLRDSREEKPTSKSSFSDKPLFLLSREGHSLLLIREEGVGVGMSE